jgi:hypothetical protein
MRESIEIRRNEWGLQSNLAAQDYSIGSQQVLNAGDEVQVVTQEHQIASLQMQHASATIAFLTTKFLNVDLYEWMSDILENVYRFLLQQATAMARLAENQLAFERQEPPQGLVQQDYWTARLITQGLASSSPDRKGLTGAERLLQDTVQLDQYAFLTDRRKLQITKTIPLATLVPLEFQKFRETGFITFNTPMELFDRDFPGHYLRLIKQVRVSVIALVPPAQGIHATLTTTGLSRVVIGQDVFQAVPIRRDPELIALTATTNATGLFQLTPQSDPMLMPFENTGVAATWEFRMEKPSNLLDFDNVADVLLTLDYTALSDLTYRQQIIQSLETEIGADKPYSLRNQFPDQWYDLHNPEQSSTPMTIRFTTVPEDFPPNLSDLRIQHLQLYFSRVDGAAFEIDVDRLRFTPSDNTGTVGGGSRTIDGVISTRRGNAGSWTAAIGKSPLGEWELALPPTDEIRAHFTQEDIKDILFVITYRADSPPWAP